MLRSVGKVTLSEDREDLGCIISVASMYHKCCIVPRSMASSRGVEVETCWVDRTRDYASGRISGLVCSPRLDFRRRN